MNFPRAVRTAPTLRTSVAVLLTLFTTAATVLLATAPRAEAATLTPVPFFGSDPGNLGMYAYVPDGLPDDAPLVVLLHGCGQDAAAYHAHSGWAEHADAFGFALVYAEQSYLNNFSRCFNWFSPGDVARGSGEAASVRSMIGYAVAEYGLDTGRVYVSGLSAGGAMAGELLAAYPDVFAGGSVVAGVPVGCADSMIAAFTCMNPGVTRSPEQWGDQVRAKYPDWTGPWPRVAVWHGTADYTVVPANADASVAQWTNVAGVPEQPDSTETIGGSTTAAYHGGGPTTAAVARYTVSGMGHGVPVEPSTGCGSAGAYFLDTVCSTGHTVAFWGIGEPVD
ncbi:PHB depolymerase family esterase [Nocardiopsis sp. FIRDI 009]|uniref:extracellular catalytic domain type 1 short-chain-length polyhydroxyalkanoate depolymerase n=1 Tax=Nocardiopsis sp. FIRDI 009 TaxID=714197 RepID=UPI0018E4FA77|nr:PHB depolymerase family esterase [Nocardiopsis sp. FIRDI 009]